MTTVTVTFHHCLFFKKTGKSHMRVRTRIMPKKELCVYDDQTS